MKQRRQNKYTFYALIDKEKGKKLEKILIKQQLTKTQWLNEKIEQDNKK